VAKRKVIIKNGTISFIYNDAMKPFLDLGDAKVTRASHVEPMATGEGVKWTADMSPSNGPLLGANGEFDTRQEALDAEVEWLNNHHLGIK